MVSGVSGGAVAYGIAAWASGAPKGTTWVVAARHEDAERLQRELRYHLQDALPVVAFPGDDVRPYEGASPHPALPRQRLVALDLVRRGAPALVVTTARALQHRVLPPDVLASHQVALKLKQTLDRSALLRRLADWGYLATGVCDEPGTLATRGEVLDIWPSDREQPVRIELYDDEIEDIRPLDPATQRSAGAGLQGLRLLPAREGLLTPEALTRASELLARGVDETGAGHAVRRRVLSDLREGLWFPGAEDYLPALHALVAPLSYGGRVIVVDHEAVAEELDRFERQVHTRWDAAAPEDRPALAPEARYVPAAEVLGALAEARRLDPMAPDAPHLGTRDNASLRVGTGELAPVAETLRGWLDEGWQVVFAVDSHARAERLYALLEPHRLRPKPMPPAELPPPGVLGLWLGDLDRGFQAPTSRIAVVAADELFGPRSHSKPRTTLREATVQSFAQLKANDLVVHARHGIGRFEGLTRMPVQMTQDAVWGIERPTSEAILQDFVILSFRDGDKLYLPVTRLEELARYQAVGDHSPRLDKLGGDAWVRRKEKVKDRVLALAHELLRMHAMRATVRGHAYEGLPELYRQFEQTFPYTETPDQAAAIQDVLDDLAKPEPMDRLIIGDVGFGKTEVAMRAATRVILDGYQVAVLCPTTVLAYQHHETFLARFADLPVNIELLSRFRTPAETSAVLQATVKGQVDILIGTTALLGRSLHFKKLGLVVVDEEHRFGVKQKEKLKKLATDVDYLAMSATPIPRTLHMAMSGLRKVSVVATPPASRQATRTRVSRYSEAHVRDEILHELQRGGQVFYIHNRISGLAKAARTLEELVPEARVGVAHGQMDADALECVLIDFMRHTLNILVCTSIIETGIDMPSVNTMIIERADQMGLAQLYQLRGRVGRGGVRGHCLLLIPETGAISADALRRLQVLQENTELGAGFAIANADLELRGAGNLLGEEQHGQIEAVGLDTYLELLQEAVAEATGEETHHRIDPEVEIPVPALLPEDYIADLDERLVEYRRLAVCRTVGQVQELIGAWEDRYGRPPPEVLNLGWIAEARVRCRSLGILRVSLLKVRMILDFHPSTPVTPGRIVQLLTEQPNRYALPKRRVANAPADEPWRLEVRVTPQEAEHPFRFLHHLLEVLGG